MELNEQSYYGVEMSMKYVSVSQYKAFCGTANKVPCEAAALAEAQGKITHKPTQSMLVGSFVDAALTDDIERFKAEHQEILVSRGERKGELKSEFAQAEIMIERARRDSKFMAFLDGEHQKILTGDVANVPFKIKIDALPELHGKPVAIVDLKTVKGMHEVFRVKDSGEFISWIENWGYDLQGACYQEIYYQNYGVRLPFYLAAISKDKDSFGEAHPRIKVIQIPQKVMDERLVEVKNNIGNIQAIKNGEIDPVCCGKCDFCADTLPCEVISMDELMLEV